MSEFPPKDEWDKIFEGDLDPKATISIPPKETFSVQENEAMKAAWKDVEDEETRKQLKKDIANVKAQITRTKKNINALEEKTAHPIPGALGRVRVFGVDEKGGAATEAHVSKLEETIRASERRIRELNAQIENVGKEPSQISSPPPQNPAAAIPPAPGTPPTLSQEPSSLTRTEYEPKNITEEIKLEVPANISQINLSPETIKKEAEQKPIEVPAQEKITEGFSEIPFAPIKKAETRQTETTEPEEIMRHPESLFEEELRGEIYETIERAKGLRNLGFSARLERDFGALLNKINERTADAKDLAKFKGIKRRLWFSGAPEDAWSMVGKAETWLMLRLEGPKGQAAAPTAPEKEETGTRKDTGSKKSEARNPDAEKIKNAQSFEALYAAIEENYNLPKDFERRGTEPLKWTIEHIIREATNPEEAANILDTKDGLRDKVKELLKLFPKKKETTGAPAPDTEKIPAPEKPTEQNLHAFFNFDGEQYPWLNEEVKNFLKALYRPKAEKFTQEELQEKLKNINDFGALYTLLNTYKKIEAAPETQQWRTGKEIWKIINDVLQKRPHAKEPAPFNRNSPYLRGIPDALKDKVVELFNKQEGKQ